MNFEKAAAILGDAAVREAMAKVRRLCLPMFPSFFITFPLCEVVSLYMCVLP